MKFYSYEKGGGAVLAILKGSPEDVGNWSVMVGKLVLRTPPGRWLLIGRPLIPNGCMKYLDSSKNMFSKNV